MAGKLKKIGTEDPNYLWFLSSKCSGGLYDEMFWIAPRRLSSTKAFLHALIVLT